MQVHTLDFSPQRQPMHHDHTHINQEDSPPIDIDSENKGINATPQRLTRHHPTIQPPTTCADTTTPDNIKTSRQ